MPKWKEFINLSKKLRGKLIGRCYLNKYNLYSIAHHSSAIEGSKLTFDESWRLLEHKVFPSRMDTQDQSIFMVVDHYNVLVYTLEQAKMKLPISISLLEKINSFVKKRTGEKGICNITGEYYDTYLIR